MLNLISPPITSCLFHSLPPRSPQPPHGSAHWPLLVGGPSNALHCSASSVPGVLQPHDITPNPALGVIETLTLAIQYPPAPEAPNQDVILHSFLPIFCQNPMLLPNGTGVYPLTSFATNPAVMEAFIPLPWIPHTLLTWPPPFSLASVLHPCFPLMIGALPSHAGGTWY